MPAMGASVTVPRSSRFPIFIRRDRVQLDTRPVPGVGQRVVVRVHDRGHGAREHRETVDRLPAVDRDVRQCAAADFEYLEATGRRTEHADNVVKRVTRHNAVGKSPVQIDAHGLGHAQFDALLDESLEQVSSRLAKGLTAAASGAGITTTSNRVGSMMTTFFTDGPVRDFESAARTDTRRYARFFHGMLQRGIYLAPSAFEAAFVSTCHGDTEVEATVSAAAESFQELAEGGS